MHKEIITGDKQDEIDEKDIIFWQCRACNQQNPSHIAIMECMYCQIPKGKEKGYIKTHEERDLDEQIRKAKEKDAKKNIRKTKYDPDVYIKCPSTGENYWCRKSDIKPDPNKPNPPYPETQHHDEVYENIRDPITKENLWISKIDLQPTPTTEEGRKFLQEYKDKLKRPGTTPRPITQNQYSDRTNEMITKSLIPGINTPQIKTGATIAKRFKLPKPSIPTQPLTTPIKH